MHIRGANLLKMSVVAAMLVFFRPPHAYAVADFSVLAIDFPKHALPGELLTFRVSVRNNEATAQVAYMAVVLTLIGKGNATEFYSGATSISAGQVGTLTAQRTNAPAGMFTVSVVVFDALDERSAQGVAPEPLHVGSLVDEISVTPMALDFGQLDYGRQMLPVPVEVAWSHFLFDRLRKDQPWYLRVYTDNATRFTGIPGALRRASPGGLVSSDGRYAIPIKIWTVNFGPDVHETGWDALAMGPPPLDDRFWKGPLLDTGERDDDRAVWQSVPDLSEMTSNTRTWRTLIGQDPFSSQYVNENNPTGDFTLPSPFTCYFAVDTTNLAIEGRYRGSIIFEIYSP